MLDPITALLGAGVLSVLAYVIFWPEIGLIWRWRQGKRDTERIFIEDALKQLYDQEYKDQMSTLESLSGALGISRDHTARLLARLQALELIESRGSGFILTAAGRSYALRVIRVHRLWERYFADETGLAETDWHKQAELREHETTPEEAEALARQMGNPVRDPHGDPIPTSNGELPPRRGIPLTDLASGEMARIIHIEDEPGELYAQLVAQGLYPGMQLRVLDKSAQRLRFVAEGEEIVLAPVAATNVTVLPLPKEQEMAGPYETLNSLEIGESGVVLGIAKSCRGLQRRRLLDLGIIPGTTISAELRSASGNPTAYNIRGATIALRNEQANLIHIKRKEAA